MNSPTSNLNILELPLIVLERKSEISLLCKEFLDRDQELSGAEPLDETIIDAFSESLQNPQVPEYGAHPPWRTALLGLASSVGSIGVLACHLRALAAVTCSFLSILPDDQVLESSHRIHWTVFLGLESAARAAARELSDSLYTSEVTILRNRKGLERDAERYFPAPTITSVAFLDMDGLKYINDSFGHNAGDEALQSVAANLVSFLGDYATSYHFSGDEFAVLAKSVEPDSLREELENVYGKSKHKFSFGIAAIQPRNEDWRISLDNAEVAMRKQKADRKTSGIAPQRGQEPA